MGAKKPLLNSTKLAKSTGKAINKSRAQYSGPSAKTGNTKVTASNERTVTPVKTLEKSTQNKNEKDTSIKLKTTKPQEKKIPARSPSPKKAINRSKNVEDKSKAINKVIKSLDIKISGFRNIASQEQKAECKPSISEIVKTKFRAASAKISPGPLGKHVKRNDVDNTSTLKSDSENLAGSKTLVGSKKKQKKGKCVKNISVASDSVIDESATKSKISQIDNPSFENLKCSEETTSLGKDVNQISIESAVIDGCQNAKDEKKSCDSSLGQGKVGIKTKNTKKTGTIKSAEEKPILGKKVQKENLVSKDALTVKNSEGSHEIGTVDEYHYSDKDSNKEEQQNKSKTNSKSAINKGIQKQVKNKAPKKTGLKKSTNWRSPVESDKTTVRSNDDTPNVNNEVEKSTPVRKSVEVAKGSNSKTVVLTVDDPTEKIASCNSKTDQMEDTLTTHRKAPESSCIEMKIELKIEETIKKNQEGISVKIPKIGNKKCQIKTDNKTQSVRERLQKKYMGSKTTTFKAFKAKKQTVSAKKRSMSPSKSPKREQCRNINKKSAKTGDDIYDFNSESDSEDNIKMNLIIETSMLSKLSKLAKSKEREKKKAEQIKKQNKCNEKVECIQSDEKTKLEFDQKVDDDDSNDISEQVFREIPKADDKPESAKCIDDLHNKKEALHLKKGKEPVRKRKPDSVVSPKTAKEKFKNKDKDFSDEDDRPLKETKKMLDDAKQDTDLGANNKQEKSFDDDKADSKKITKQCSISKSKPTKKVPVVKRKARSDSSNSDESENEESDETSSSSESCQVFGPKRHRMASLNALAKVQCLYENESRTAHELGLSKSSQAPKIRIIASGSSSDEDENALKQAKKEEAAEEAIKEEQEEEAEVSSAPEEENKRELRNVPGLRGMGKHWDFNEVSSFESGHESDVTFCHSDEKPKSKKRKIVKPKPITKIKDKSEPPKSKKAVVQKSVKKKPQSPKEISESSSEEENEKSQQKKRKREDTPEIKHNVTAKRMASLNASAIVAATYEVERHLDRNLDSDCSSFESITDDVNSESTKKKDKNTPAKADVAEEASKENNSRPTSSSVVIVQDTDVTITGVYVNSSTGSSQEAYCKMQYRVQSSVTEERVLRPNSIDPPKSYTPLTALSSMRPPGTDAGQTVLPEDLSPSNQQQTFQPTIVCRGDQPPISSDGQHQQPSSHIYSHHHHGPPHTHPSHEQLHHMHHQQSSPKYHHMYHHHQQPPLAQPRCESPLRYPSGPYQNVQPPMPPPPNTISISGGGSSAFCAPSMQPSHHDSSGYYQPAGPLISQHAHPPTQTSNTSIVSSAKQISSPLDAERDHHLSQISQQHPTDNPDNDVLITGGDLSTFRYSSQQAQSQQSQALSLPSAQPPPAQQSSPYSRQIHQMHYSPYPPTYYTPYASDAMCYPSPYQHYFPKVYQSAPTYRRYSSYYPPGPPPPPNELYDPQPPPSNVAQPPPPSGSQLIATGPSAQQHIDHYPGPPGFYSGYNPNGGECYATRGMQPPYMEYPAPCPCPMQSCPKNVLTGPLIGSSIGNNNSLSNISPNSHNLSSNTISASTNLSNNTKSATSIANNNVNTLTQQLKTNKGPVRMPNNNLCGQHEKALPSGQVILGKPVHHHPVACKLELIDSLNSELKADVINETVISGDNRKTGQYEETVVQPTLPSVYNVNDKLTESESLVSSGRSPTVPQIMAENGKSAGISSKEIESNAQIEHNADYEKSQSIQTPLGNRKARIGKTMAREMMYGAHIINPAQQLSPACGNLSCSYQTQHSHHASHNTATDANISSDCRQNALSSEISRIKKEDIKIEEEDDVVILEDDVKEVKCEAESVEVLEKRLDLEDYRQCKDIENELLVPRLQAKRMKILDNRSICKKSAPNGYKSLIKQTEPKSYLCLATLKRNGNRRFRKCSRFAARGVIRKRKLVLTEQQKQRLATHKQKLLMLEKNNQQKRKTLSKKVASTGDRNEKHQLEESSRRFVETVDVTPEPSDNRGYFSEPDIRSSTSRKTRKTRASETRSKSESKKSKFPKKSATNKIHTSDETIPKLPENNVFVKKLNTSKVEPLMSKKLAQSKSLKEKPKSKDHQPNIYNTNLNVAQSLTSSAVAEAMILDEPVTLEDRTTEQNNNGKTMEHSELTTLSAGTGNKTNYSGKRSRTKGSRFSRKRPKCRRYQMEVDNSIIPRKLNAVPKWNNGWSWLGEPFQAKIFLNSDDPLVIRTCYAAMQHIEGDIIRPRDCVLLKAGNKKNELPYVAKVAHLWENPEDGEMMMSLLWYYRPEHTEQGRQPNDSPDEVFASRHRDHNSVACIEDKCYVLTFSEYCRHRRRVRAAEEGVEGEIRIVPQIKLLNSPPVTTNPEQVMFCQRVYEFRMKRLLKTPTN